MNSRERFLAVCRNEDYDRLPLGEFGYWAGTLKRWYEEGLRCIDYAPDRLSPGRGVCGEFRPFRYGYPIEWSPGMQDREVNSLLGFDAPYEMVPFIWEPYPFFDQGVVEERQTTQIIRDRFGVLKEQNKDGVSIARFIDYPIKTREDFDCMMDERYRIDNLQKRYPPFWDLWKERNRDRTHPTGFDTFPFGIFSCIREWMGLEHYFITLVENPQLIEYMLGRYTDFLLALWNDALSQIDIDFVMIWEDMCFKSGPLISPKHFSTHMIPCYKRIASFLKDHGVDIVMVDTDGDCTTIVPCLIEGGVNYVFPMEIASGLDIIQIRKLYPDLVIGGGIDKRELPKGKQAIDKELEKVEFMVQQGRYIPYTDHLVDPNLSWDNFLYYRRRVREIVEKSGKEKSKKNQVSCTLSGN